MKMVDYNRDDYNTNGIKGTRKKYPKRKVNYKEHDNDILYNQYGFDLTGFNKDGYNYMDLIKID